MFSTIGVTSEWKLKNHQAGEITRKMIKEQKEKRKQRCGSCEEVYIERGQMFVSVRVTR